MSDGGHEVNGGATVTCLSETAKAILVSVAGKALWIPKSVLHDDSEVWKAGDEGVLVVNEWWAEREGLD
jgi:Ser-tRNA(Ala) deacylase AlaX